MAFSAHNDMGQNERVETTHCTSTRRSTSVNSESKFIPNPSAQPFVPKWNSSSSQRLDKILSQNAENIFEYGSFRRHADRPLEIMNGVTSPLPPSGPPSQHIALHLLSKLLDDETIFNLEEGNPAAETLLPLSVDPDIRPSDVSSWTSPSPHASPDYDPEQRLSSSMSGENIWQNSDINQNSSIPTPITSASPLSHAIGWATQSQISPHGAYPVMVENSPTVVNGFENLPSPQMSSSLESVGNGGYYSSRFCSPVVPDEWKQLSDSETNSCGDMVDQGPYEYNRVSPVYAAGLVCLSGSWPQKTKVLNGYSGTNERDSDLTNGYCSSWKGSEMAEQPGRRVQFRRSNSSKSDDETWLNCGKESGYCRQVPSNGLHLRLDQCYEQLKYLEKERHKADLDICKFWPTRRISSSGTITTGRSHHSSSRVDRLLVDILKEHAKVEALVGRIERIRHSPLNINISESVDELMACIRRLQSYRKEEMGSLGGRSKKVTGPRSPDGKDLISLVAAVRDLAISTRRCRTSVWCASQLALAEISKIATQSSRRHSSNSESAVESSLPSPTTSGVS